MAEKAASCAREVLEVVPSVMRFIRTEMRNNRALDLGVPQFRSLMFIERTPGASLTAVAGHLGLTPPSACKIIDGLSGRGLVTRRESPRDRRRLTLALTAAGARALASARAGALRSLAARIGPLGAADQAAIIRAMDALRGVFTAEGKERKNGNP